MCPDIRAKIGEKLGESRVLRKSKHTTYGHRNCIARVSKRLTYETAAQYSRAVLSYQSSQLSFQTNFVRTRVEGERFGD
jgi:hypothetical protein